MLSHMHASFACLVDKLRCSSSASRHVELRRIAKIFENPRILLSLLQSQWSICGVKPCRVFEAVDSSRVLAAWREEAGKKSLHQRDEEMESTTQTGTVELQKTLDDCAKTLKHQRRLLDALDRRQGRRECGHCRNSHLCGVLCDEMRLNVWLVGCPKYVRFLALTCSLNTIVTQATNC